MIASNHFRQTTLTAIVAAGWALGLSLPANATLLGDTVTITSTANVPLDTWVDEVVVSGDIELLGVENPANAPPYPNNGETFQHANAILGGNVFPDLFAGDFIDIDESSITFNYVALGQLAIDIGVPAYAFQTIFSGLDWVGPLGPGELVGVQLDGPCDDVDNDQFCDGLGLISSFNISNITASSFTFQATVDLVNGANFTLDLVAVHIPVPEPATLPLFAAGLLGLIYCLERG